MCEGVVLRGCLRGFVGFTYCVLDWGLVVAGILLVCILRFAILSLAAVGCLLSCFPF